MGKSDLAIEANGLVKVFGKTRAVDGLDLAVARGGVHGILGPNGAGKTTTMRILATLLPADAGVAKVLGHDVARESAAVRRQVAMTGQFASVDADLTGAENLEILSGLAGLNRAAARSRTADLLAAFGLADAGGRQVKKYSGGMRRRIDIAASIVVTPQLLFLDEPTTGLDPRSRNEVWEIVRAMVRAGTTVILTTQYLDEADQLADRISVIDHGKVIAEGTPTQLKASVGAGSVTVRVIDPGDRERALTILSAELATEAERSADPHALTIQVGQDRNVAAALGALETSGIGIAQFAFGQPTLDEVFLTLTGRPAEDEPGIDNQERDSNGQGDAS